jgi:hypothetical protein
VVKKIFSSWRLCVFARAEYFLPNKIAVRQQADTSIQHPKFKIQHFLYLFLTFRRKFTKTHQNHPKTTSLFNRISHFLIVFCRFLSLFSAFPQLFRCVFAPIQRTYATPITTKNYPLSHLRFRAKPAHLEAGRWKPAAISTSALAQPQSTHLNACHFDRREKSFFSFLVIRFLNLFSTTARYIFIHTAHNSSIC